MPQPPAVRESSKAVHDEFMALYNEAIAYAEKKLIELNKTIEELPPLNPSANQTCDVSGSTLIGTPMHHSQPGSFQTAATPIMQGIIDLHNDIMVYLVFILVFVLYLLVVIIVEFGDPAHKAVTKSIYG